MSEKQIKEMASRAWVKYLEDWSINREEVPVLDRESYIRGYIAAIKTLVNG